MSETVKPVEETAEKDIDTQIAGWLSGVFKGDAVVRGAATALLTLRRAYSIAHGILAEQIRKLRDLNPELPPDILDLTVKLMSEKAVDHNDPQQTLMSLGQVTLGFLDEQVRLILKEESLEIESITNEEEQERRKRSIFIPIFKEDSEHYRLDRNQSALFVVSHNFPAAQFSQWFIEKMCEDPVTVKKQMNVVFHAEMFGHPDDAYNYFHFPICATPKSEPICNKFGNFAGMLKAKMTEFQIFPDLMFADNLSAMFKSSFLRRHPANNAADAHRIIKKSARSLGYAITGLVLVEDEVIDLTSPTYEALRNHSRLYRLAVVGEHETAATIEVSNVFGEVLNQFTISLGLLL